MGTVKVTNIEPIADNGTVTLGGSGDTITLGSGATNSLTGLVKIAEKTVASGDASTTAFNFENCFSSTYKNYRVVFYVEESGTASANAVLQAALGTGSGDFSSGTDFWAGHQYMKINTSSTNTGDHRYNSSNRASLFGTVEVANGDCHFTGVVDISFPNDSNYRTTFNGQMTMYNPAFYSEAGGGMETSKASHTNLSLRIASGQDSNGSEKSTSFTDYPVYGCVQIYGYN